MPLQLLFVIEQGSLSNKYIKPIAGFFAHRLQIVVPVAAAVVLVLRFRG
jgi:hypothetical protein